MLTFNNKILRNRKLYPPVLAFDADLRKLSFTRVSRTDGETISFSINNGEDIETSEHTFVNYNLPQIDTEYDIDYKVLADTVKHLDSDLITSKIFMNHENCKYFKYGDYTSQHINAYTGTNANVVIPQKHNLLNTTSATILSFPNVPTNNVRVTLPYTLQEFNIKDDKIVEFTLSGNRLKPYQFANLPNLLNINGELSSVPAYAFYNCPMLSMNPMNTNAVTEFGDYAFHNTPSQKTLVFSGRQFNNTVFDSTDHKYIFTTANTINGFNQFTVVDNPQDLYGQICFPRFNKLTWTGSVPNNDTVHIVYFSMSSGTFRGKNLGAETIVFETDANVLGLYLNVINRDGTAKFKRYWMPKNTSYSSSSVITDFVETDGNKRYFYISASEFYNGAVPKSSDIFYMKAIHMNGFGSECAETITGQDGYAEPQRDIVKAIYVNTTTKVEYTINGATTYFGGGGGRAVRLILDADENFSIWADLYDSDGNLRSLNINLDNYIQKVDTRSHLITYSLSNLFSNYINLNSSWRLECFYVGFSNSRVSVRLNSKLSYTTSD